MAIPQREVEILVCVCVCVCVCVFVCVCVNSASHFVARIKARRGEARGYHDLAKLRRRQSRSETLNLKVCSLYSDVQVFLQEVA